MVQPWQKSLNVVKMITFGAAMTKITECCQNDSFWCSHDKNHWMLSKWQLMVQPWQKSLNVVKMTTFGAAMTKISWEWLFCFSAAWLESKVRVCLMWVQTLNSCYLFYLYCYNHGICMYSPSHPNIFSHVYVSWISLHSLSLMLRISSLLISDINLSLCCLKLMF